MSHGRHVKVLGKGQPDLLGDPVRVSSFLLDLVHSLGMRPLGKPHLYEVEAEIAKLNVEPFEDEGGVTGVVVLSTSHCSIHTWPLRPFFVLDVYSCRDFDTGVVLQGVGVFEAYDIKLTDISHSLEYTW